MEQVVKISNFQRLKSYYHSAFGSMAPSYCNQSDRGKLMKKIDSARYLQFMYFLKEGNFSAHTLSTAEPRKLIYTFVNYLKQNLDEVLDTMTDQSVAEIVEEHPELMTGLNSEVFFTILKKLGL